MYKVCYEFVSFKSQSHILRSWILRFMFKDVFTLGMKMFPRFQYLGSCKNSTHVGNVWECQECRWTCEKGNVIREQDCCLLKLRDRADRRKKGNMCALRTPDVTCASFPQGCPLRQKSYANKPGSNSYNVDMLVTYCVMTSKRAFVINCFVNEN